MGLAGASCVASTCLSKHDLATVLLVDKQQHLINLSIHCLSTHFLQEERTQRSQLMDAHSKMLSASTRMFLRILSPRRESKKHDGSSLRDQSSHIS